MKGAHSAIAIRLLFAGCALLCAPCSRADEATIGEAAAALARAHPPGSIATAEAAQLALRDAQDARSRIEWSAYAQEVDCQKRFFVTSCASRVRRERRAALEELRRVEVDANRFLRRLKDAQREEKRQQSMRDAQEREARLAADRVRDRVDYAKRQEDALHRQARFEADAPQRAAAAEREGRRRAQRAAHARQSASLEADAIRRTANARAYEEKQHDARTRRAELAKKRAERAAKQGSAASRPPGADVAAPAS